MNEMSRLVPQEILDCIKRIEKAGFEAFLVGGCVRDLLLGKTPGDWDMASNATPDKLVEIFGDDAVYENSFGTVSLKSFPIEITTYRKEGTYSDKRHPDSISFAKELKDDLGRRDFTINALALDADGKVIDLFNGQADLKLGIIRAVNDPQIRFDEDALRMLRAIRFASQLSFVIEPKTAAAIMSLKDNLSHVAKERIRDEFEKIIMSDRASDGVEMLVNAGLMKYIIPEVLEGVNCGQNKHHIYTVFKHCNEALRYSTNQKYSLEVRLASLLHDVGKPRTKRGDGIDSTFHGHEVIGARIASKRLRELAFSSKVLDKVVHLIRYHMFYYNVGEITDAGVRRFVKRVGAENIDDLIRLREADRIGSGVEKAVPYKLRHLLFMIEKVKQDPIEPKMLKLRGDELMNLLKLEASPRVGLILHALMEEVLDDPAKNDFEYLKTKALELNKLDEKELLKFKEKALLRADELEAEAESQIKRKFKV